MPPTRMSNGLKQVQVSRNPATIFGRTPAFAFLAVRISNAGLGLQRHFDYHDVFPLVSKIIEVHGPCPLVRQHFSQPELALVFRHALRLIFSGRGLFKRSAADREAM